jgi:hypothetical protein
MQHQMLLQHPFQDNYRLLRIYAWYRALLASVLLGMFTVDVVSTVLGRIHPVLYGNTVENLHLYQFCYAGKVVAGT